MFEAKVIFDAARLDRAVYVPEVDDTVIVYSPVQTAAVVPITILNYDVMSISLKVEFLKIVCDCTAVKMRAAVSSHNSTLTS